MEQYSKYEKARIIGARALQISQGAPPYLKLDEQKLAELEYDPLRIATIEFDQDLIPISVRRPLPKKMEVIEEGDIAEVEESSDD